MTDSSSVTTDVLADQERQFPDGRLSGDPPVSYLAESESPAYVLTNKKRGLGLGTKRRTTEPDGDRGTVCLVTARRVLCLVGMDDDDFVIDIPYTAVASASAHTGLFANRLELRTPRKGYHCWTGRDTDETVAAAAAFISDRLSADPEPLDRNDGASRVTYRGHALDEPDGSGP